MSAVMQTNISVFFFLFHTQGEEAAFATFIRFYVLHGYYWLFSVQTSSSVQVLG